MMYHRFMKISKVLFCVNNVKYIATYTAVSVINDRGTMNFFSKVGHWKQQLVLVYDLAGKSDN